MTAVIITLDTLYPVDLQSRSLSQAVLAEDGTILRTFADDNGVWRYPITLDQVSPNYLEALLTYEDQYFYSHPGINPAALVRAIWLWLRNGHIVSGGSTLTMQVARIRYPEPRTVSAKLKEIIRALQLEWHYSKDDILTYYLNHAPFGGTIEGIQAAAFSYLGHSAEHLTDAQAALLAVLPQAPSFYRPDRHPERARQARDKLMHRLVVLGQWSPAQFEDAAIEDVQVSNLPRYQTAPLLARRLANQYQDQNIQTFIQAQWQQQVEELLRGYVRGIGQQVSAAALVVDNDSGKVRVYAGSADFEDDKRFAYVDMVQAIRSPGSTLKPFIYGMALDQGLIHSASLLMDVPLRFGDYQPDNFNGGFSGPVSVTTALQKSLNIPAVQVMERLKPVYFFLQMKQAGIELQLPGNARPNLAVALGGVGTRLEDLVYAYTSLGNKGNARSLRFSTADSASQQPLLSEGAAWIIRKILFDNEANVAGLAVKTGTSYGFRDAWAIAVSQHYTLGVWIGRPDGTPMPGHYGQVTAVPLLNLIFQRLNDQRPVPAMPDSVTETDICWPQGEWVTQDCEQLKRAYVLENTIPTTWYSTLARQRAFVGSDFLYWQAKDSGLRVTPDCQIPALQQTVTVWPAPLEHWLSPELQRDSRIPVWDPRCHSPGTLLQQSVLQIRGVDDQDAFQVRQNQNIQMDLYAQGGDAPFYWFLNGSLLPETGRRIQLKDLSSGIYQLTLMDQTGETDRIEFNVLVR
ncbi:penicillin-binding protein 1C [Gynuella sunshinyii]|nr:penicillin-binding protein 1C [Gynuella sunshinyii]